MSGISSGSSEAVSAVSATAKKIRFNSVDALRGLTVAAMLLVNNAGDWDHVYAFLEHASWHGTTPADFIFPFFLVIVGVSLQLALGSQIEVAQDRWPLARGVILRGVRIIALGVLLHLLSQYLIPGRGFRLFGVLQRIGLCFMVVGCLIIYLRSWPVQIAIFCATLLAYWGLLVTGGSLEPHLNLADRLDTFLLGSWAYNFDVSTGLAQEPEGLLSTLPAMMSVLLGCFAGRFLRDGQLLRLILVGVAALIVAYFWSFIFPLNKQLWTSSFVLWTGGFALLALALAHYLIDRNHAPALGISFGVNAIAAYAGAWIATCVLAATGAMELIYGGFFKPLIAPSLGNEFASFCFAASFTSVFGVLMWVLRRKGWRWSI